jgi:hypothetical protein
MAKPNLKLAPILINGTVPPRRRPNTEVRHREYLTEGEALGEPKTFAYVIGRKAGQVA